jgi:hypothetical protein
VSPARDTLPPEALLEDYPPEMAALARGLRAVVLAAVPGAVERVRPGWRVIGYDVRVGRRSSYFAWIMPQAEHVHLGFPKGAALHDPDGALEGEGVTKLARWFTLERVEDLLDPRLASFAQLAADLATLGRTSGSSDRPPRSS